MSRPTADRDDPESVQAAKDARRAARHSLRRRLRAVWRTDRVKGCGRAGGRPDGSVVVRWTPAGLENGPTVGFSGVMACGNVWLCPECAMKVAARKAARVERVLRAAVEAGGWAVLVTLTARHNVSQTLDVLMKGVRYAWSKVRSGRRWQDDRADLGVLGVVRAVEITHGAAGWHPHVHCIVVFDHVPSRESIAALTAGMFRRWRDALVRKGIPAPIAGSGGLDVCHLGSSPALRERTYASVAAWARYAVKGITGESVMGVVKDAKGRNRSIPQLMHDAVEGTRWVADDGAEVVTLDDTARALLLEYEAATKAVKHLTGTAQLEQALGLDVDEATDEDIVNEELGGEDVAVIAGGYWDELVEPVAASLAQAGEVDGPAGIRRWLHTHGVPWSVPTAGAGRTWADGPSRLRRRGSSMSELSELGVEEQV